MSLRIFFVKNTHFFVAHQPACSICSLCYLHFACTSSLNNNNGEFLHSSDTMLCALHTHHPWSLHLTLFIHVPFQLPVGAYNTGTISALVTYHTHCLNYPRTQHRNNDVLALRCEKHDISLKILLQHISNSHGRQLC